MEPCGCPWPRWQESQALVPLTEGEEDNSRKTECRIRIYRILQVLRQQCNVCGFRSRVQTFEVSGRLVMVTLSGSSTAMALGAESFRNSLTHASRRWGSVVVWETVTPTCHKM